MAADAIIYARLCVRDRERSILWYISKDWYNKKLLFYHVWLISAPHLIKYFVIQQDTRAIAVHGVIGAVGQRRAVNAGADGHAHNLPLNSSANYCTQHLYSHALRGEELLQILGYIKWHSC